MLGILGPDGEGRHSISGSPVIYNTDLRNYIVLGSPDSEEEPVIDQRGGIIPTAGSYTLIFGTLINDRPFYSTEIGEIEIRLHDAGYPIATVYWKIEGDTMVFDAFADRDGENESLSIEVVRGFSNHQLFITLCPIDQDGITEIPSIEYRTKDLLVTPSDKPYIKISEPPVRVVTLPANKGHAGRLLTKGDKSSNSADCSAKLASWAAAFPVRSNPTFTIVLKGEYQDDFPDVDDIEEKWEDTLRNLPIISTSDERVDELFNSSSIILRLLADTTKNIVTVGPSSQEEVWLPALVFQTKALDRLGFAEGVTKPILDQLYTSIDTNGLIIKNKQWDSQGAFLNAIAHHFFMTGDTNWLGEKFSGLKRMSDWVIRQRKRSQSDPSQMLRGLLPAGVASWFNPLYWKEDFYYGHNFWGASILDVSAHLAGALGKHGDVERLKAELEKYKQNLDDSITQITDNFDFLPAGPRQGDNTEMIFNLHAFYPLKLYLQSFQPLINTIEWLHNNYMRDGALLIDQPWNSYGTYFSILIAQANRYLENHTRVHETIEFLKNNTTNLQGWAEGISPLSLKGGVGDSPNGYAAAEWINLILDLFCEESYTSELHLLKGMPVEWLKMGVSIKNLHMFNNETMELSAKLTETKLKATWKYSGDSQKVKIILCTPYSITNIAAGTEQLSSFQLVLEGTEGEAEVEISIPS